MDIKRRIKEWQDAAETLSDDFAASRRKKPGPKPIRPKNKVATSVDNTPEETEMAYKIAAIAMGGRARGAKQWAYAALYLDLAAYCLRLKKAGIRPPRGGSLSIRAAMHGLGEILRWHGYMGLDEGDHILLYSERRYEIGKMLANQFDRIARAMDAE